jgi:hypothetical protein
MDKVQLRPVGDSSQYPKHIQNRIRNTQGLGGCTSQYGRNVDALFLSALVLRHDMP